MRKRPLLEHLPLALAVLFAAPALAQADLTNAAGTVSAQYNDSPRGEEIGKLTDNRPSTKYLTFHATGWVQFKSASAAVVTKYALTSANDHDERDPQRWTFQGSSNGSTWTTLDTRANQDFPTRFLRREFSFANNAAYSYYRLQATNNRGTILQLAEWEIYERQTPPPLPPPTAQIISPAANAGFTAPASVTISVQTTNTPTSSAVKKVEYFSNGTKIGEVTTLTGSGRYDYVWTGVPAGTYALTARATSYEGLVGPLSAAVAVTVKSSTTTGGWENFKYPEIIFEDLSPGSPGSKAFHTAIPDPVAAMRAQILALVKKLHYNANDNVRSFTKLYYTIEDYDGVAEKWGSPPEIYIRVSTRHLQNVLNNSNGDYNAIRTEILGILSHEGTHGYQYEPKNAGEYDGQSEFYGFIEGLADAVRISVGLHPDRTPELGGSWRDGYTTSGFFIYWMALKKDPSFLIKFQNTARTYANWSWDAACKEILGVGVQPLWDEYQTWIRNGKVGLPAAKASGLAATNKNAGIIDMKRYSCISAPGATQHGDALRGVRATANDLTLFPNPAVSTLTLKGIASFPASVGIYDAKGVLRQTVRLTHPSEAVNLDCSALEGGFYLIRTVSSKGVQTQRLLKH